VVAAAAAAAAAEQSMPRFNLGAFMLLIVTLMRAVFTVSPVDWTEPVALGAARLLGVT